MLRVRPHVKSYGRITSTKVSRWEQSALKVGRDSYERQSHRSTRKHAFHHRVLVYFIQKTSILRWSYFSTLKERSFDLMMRKTLTTRLPKPDGNISVLLRDLLCTPIAMQCRWFRSRTSYIRPTLRTRVRRAWLDRVVRVLFFSLKMLLCPPYVVGPPPPCKKIRVFWGRSESIWGQWHNMGINLLGQMRWGKWQRPVGSL